MVCASGEPKLTEDGGWISFLGLFWMTAPIAWLCAIPVERFQDSIAATYANVELLLQVSSWRVLLMARVLQVTTKAPFLMAVCWVLFVFGDGFSSVIMASMGGMRNSPEQEIMRHATSNTFGVAFWLAPIALMLSIAWRPDELLQPLPRPVAVRMLWGGLAVAAAVWVALAVVLQRELANTVAERARDALDFMAAHQPGDFAPARPLPPKPFKWTVFTELPACFGAVLISKLDAMMSHMGPRWKRSASAAAQHHGQQVEDIVSSLRIHGPDAGGLLQLLHGLAPPTRRPSLAGGELGFCGGDLAGIGESRIAATQRL